MSEQAIKAPQPAPAEARGGEAPDWGKVTTGEPLPELPAPETSGGEGPAAGDGTS